jgi:hypothetical protein
MFSRPHPVGVLILRHVFSVGGDARQCQTGKVKRTAVTGRELFGVVPAESHFSTEQLLALPIGIVG